MSLRRSRSLPAAVAVSCIGALAAGIAGPTSSASAQRPDVRTDSQVNRPSVDRSTVLVQLTRQPLATAVTKRTADGKINLASWQAKQQRTALAAQRDAFRSWLRDNAPKARVIGSHDIAVNAVTVRLNGTSPATLRQAPQVASVEYNRYYQPVGHDDPDLDLIDAPEAWTAAAGGDADAGRLPDGSRVQVGVIDTGIDIKHPCFSDAGYPATQQRGDKQFTNNKVIVARVFNNKAVANGYTAEALQDHGTHVAGTVACNLHTPAVVDGVDIPYDPSGVAPAAQLGNYNVFPGEVGNARSEDILNALEAAYADGMDVVNMSLGGAASGYQDLLTHAVNNLDVAGMVIAISAGNSGPGHYTVGSPGSAERALTSGASTVGHFVGAPVTVAGTTYGAASGDFPTVSKDLTAPLAVVKGTTNGLSTACSALSENLTGKIALISRGACDFSTKILNAERAGAVAVLVQNNVAGDPTAMGSNGAPTQPTVPAYMVSKNSGLAMQAHNGAPTTISAALQYFNTDNDDIMAGFSSQGPTDVDFRVKPDVVAPGVNVLSSIPVSFCGATATTCWAFFQGTSMSSPHSAGAAAVVIDAFVTRGFRYSAEQVRSSIVNTAEQGNLTSYVDGKTKVTDVNIVGAGQVDLDSAVVAKVAVGPVSTSFGAVPSGSGQTLSRTVRLSSLTGTPLTLTVTVEDPADAANFSARPSTVTVPATGSTSVTVTVALPQGAPDGDYSADLNLGLAGTEVAHSPLFVHVK